ncbi:MAG: serine/threonine protein kinase, partial [Deltaproteobacteria bacterium]|nr:serine/threonine protein kinase [Kofleriaceae bacterium]
MRADGDDTTATVVDGTRRGRRRSDPPLPSGTRVGRYVLQQELARGGMGVVYRAHDPELERGVAVKVVRVRSQRALQARERLLREAQALAQLSHPNVISIHDVGTHDGDVFIAMELVDGESLRAWLRTTRPWRDTMVVLLAAGRGLAAAHAAGMVHRDFKPDNVMIGRDGRVRVLDFGLARPAPDTADPDTADPDDDDDDDDIGRETESAPDAVAQRDAPASALRFAARLTAAGGIVGTPGYMSPEQHRAAGLDALSDQFSFCVTAWEAVCGRRPFAGATLEALRAAKETKRIEAGGEAAVPARIRRILRRGLAPAPQDRFPSMDALLAA